MASKYRSIVCTLLWVSVSGTSEFTGQTRAREEGNPVAGIRAGRRVKLSSKHIAAINRKRRIVVNHDHLPDDPVMGQAADGEEAKRQLLAAKFSMFDLPGSQVDSVWWNWGEGNYAYWPSKIVKTIDTPEYLKLRAAKIDLVRLFHEETKRRGLESFFSYRINGSDNDYGTAQKIPLKEAHPDWLLHAPWEGSGTNGYWNFSIQGVRDLKLSILRELAENYDFDGLEIDFARIPIVLTIGKQWENRNHVTLFMRMVRLMLQEVAAKRGRPLLLAARVPENLEGCHFDGLDVEAWAEEQLVDIFTLGVRSLEADIPAFRRITAGTPIKLYPCIDEHHSSDGYQHPPVEVYRGTAANWWWQGADGIEVFNFPNQTIEMQVKTGLKTAWGKYAVEMAKQAQREIGSPETLKQKNKTFVVQRRGGGHGSSVIPNPEDWKTPRHMYHNTNMFSSLPAALDNEGKSDTLLFVTVGDDVNANAGLIDAISLRILLSDWSVDSASAVERLKQVPVRLWEGSADNGMGLWNRPVARQIADKVEVRLNNLLLDAPRIEEGWLVFSCRPSQFALGRNLVGVVFVQRTADTRARVFIEKLEVHLDYR